MTGSISIADGARAAFGFLTRGCARAVGALLLTGLLSGATLFALLARDFAHAWPLALACIPAAAMARGALFRTARADDRGGSTGLGGFQWGALESRLVGVVLLRAVLFGLLGSLFLAILVVIYVGVAAGEARAGFVGAAQPGWRPSLDPLGWGIVAVTGVGGLAGLCWAQLRLYLAFAATVAVERVQLLSTWTLTRSHVGKIFASCILVAAPAVALTVAARIGRGVSAWESSRAADGVFAMIIGLVQAFLVLPLSVGLMTYLYARLGPEDAGGS